MNEQEAIAAISIIGAVARADGKLSDAEKVAFREAITEFNPKLPDGTDLDKLLAEEVDLDAELKKITSPIVQKAVFEAAVAMSVIDGATTEENKILTRIRNAYSVEKQSSVLEAALQREVRIEGEQLQLDPAVREHRVRALIAKRTIWAAVFGALPLPIVSDVGVLIQLDSLVGGIALAWGHPLTRKERFARFGAVLSIAIAQGAIHSLLKFIPGWGSTAGAVGGAITAFAATYAIGNVVNYHFEKEGKTTAAELKEVFLKQKAAGKSEYEAKKGEIDQLRSKHADEIAVLKARLDKNEITKEEFNARIAELSAD